MQTGDPPAPRPDHLHIASYNVKWFSHLFDALDRPYDDDAPSARYQISRGAQMRAIGTVFRALDADGIMIIEGPDTSNTRSTIRALEAFAARFALRAHRAVHGFASSTEQEIAFLYDPERLAVRHAPMGEATSTPEHAARFDGTFRYDLDTDSKPESIRFSKPPLELALELPDGAALRMIGVHAKSKNPHGATDAAAALRISIANRRKQLAQCIWLRARVEAHLRRSEDLIVLGDFNDGPGLDEFEKLFGKSGVEVVLGQDAPPELRLYDPHALMALGGRMGFAPTSSRFYLRPQQRYFEALLDFIMVSPKLAQRLPEWRIWHPFNDPLIAADPGLREAILTASDHFPVSLQLPLSEQSGAV